MSDLTTLSPGCATTTSSAASGSPPVKGQYFENITPVTGKPFCEIPGRPPRTSRRRSTPRTRPRRTLGQDARRPNARTSSTRSPTASSRTSRCSRSPRRGTTASRSARPRRRHPARDRPLPLLRRLHPRAGGHARRARRRHRRLPLPRAARRGRPDHPVELPDPDGGVEARPGPRRRQLRRAEARRADARVDPRARRTDRRPAAAGRAQHRERLRRRGRQAARVEPAHRQDRLHRRDDDGPADHAVRQRRT
jgi:hypothetical protein